MSAGKACDKLPVMVCDNPPNALGRLRFHSRLVACSILILSYSSFPVYAQIWTGDTSPDWFDATNW